MNGIKWTAQDDNVIRKYYPDENTEDTAKRLGRSLSSTYNRAATLRVKKSSEFVNSQNSGRISKLSQKGAEFRFKAGHHSFNKGRKQSEYMTDEAIKSTEKTRFKAGQLPVNHKSVGSERISKDGYIEIKISEPRTWESKHRVEWEKVNGEIPKGLILVCKSDNKLNTSPDNWELITRVENMNRNTYHNYPKEIALSIQAMGALNRQINKRAKI